MRLGLRVVTALALLLVGCPKPCPSCGVSHPEEPTDAAAAVAPCTAAGARMTALGCREARADYVDWCTYEIGHGVPLRPVCVSQVPSCAEVDACR